MPYVIKRGSVTSGGGSGSPLPPVTPADNGKVLGVVAGRWSKMTAPSGGGGDSTYDLVVKIYAENNNNHTVTSIDKTFSEISSALTNQKSILAMLFIAGELFSTTVCVWSDYHDTLHDCIWFSFTDVYVIRDSNERSINASTYDIYWNGSASIVDIKEITVHNSPNVYLVHLSPSAYSHTIYSDDILSSHMATSYNITSGRAESLTSKVDVSTSDGSMTASCATPPTADVYMLIYLA